LRGRYVIKGVLGRGGTGTVFEAADLYRVDMPESGQRVALKVLHGQIAGKPQLFSELQREFQLLQSLSHPNVVRAFDLDRDGDIAFLTMEFLRGLSLTGVLAARNQVRFERAHALAIIRDVGTPSRTRIRARWSMAISIPATFSSPTRGRFGFSTSEPPTPRPEGPTVSAPSDRSPIATPRYASPQVLDGQRPDARDDVYSLACLSPTCSSAASTPSARKRRSGPRSSARGRRGPAGSAGKSGALCAWVSPSTASVGLPMSAMAGGFRLEHCGRAPAAVADAGARCGAPAQSLGGGGPGHRGHRRSVGRGPVGERLFRRDRRVLRRERIRAAVRCTTAQSDRSSTAAQPSPRRRRAPRHRRQPRAVAPPPSAAAPSTPARQAGKVEPAAADVPRKAIAPDSRRAIAARDEFTAAGAGPQRRPFAPAHRPTGAPLGPLPRSRLELAADTIDVPLTDPAARIVVRRRGSLQGEATFTWWTESGTAKPGQDFIAVTPHQEVIEEGKNSVSLFIPVVGDATRQQPKSFYVVINDPGPGVTLGARTLTMVTIPPSQ
jgi:hypothetical protein